MLFMDNYTKFKKDVRTVYILLLSIALQLLEKEGRPDGSNFSFK